MFSPRALCALFVTWTYTDADTVRFIHNLFLIYKTYLTVLRRRGRRRSLMLSFDKLRAWPAAEHARQCKAAALAVSIVCPACQEGLDQHDSQDLGLMFSVLQALQRGASTLHTMDPDRVPELKVKEIARVCVQTKADVGLTAALMSLIKPGQERKAACHTALARRGLKLKTKSQVSLFRAVEQAEPPAQRSRLLLLCWAV